MSELLVDIADGIAVVTLNRPDRRNALSTSLLSELTETMSGLDADNAVCVILLTGNGPAFCAGLDLNELAVDSARVLGHGAQAQREGGGHRGPFAVPSTPLVGLVNGPAITGGLELALACDFLIAGRSASFADTHSRVGILPGWGLTVRLPLLIGINRARQMSLTGEFVDAHRALAWGLVNEVVDDGDLLARGHEVGEMIVASDQAALREVRAVYDEAALESTEPAWRIEAAHWTTWPVATDVVAERRDDVVSRGRSQLRAR